MAKSILDILVFEVMLCRLHILFKKKSERQCRMSKIFNLINKTL